jgi:hypothetical protein
METRISYIRRIAQFLATAAFLLMAPNVQAGVFSLSGSFAQDDDVFLLPFKLSSAQTVTLRTWSYAGGTNAAGSSIAAGGFDPIVSLFDGAGGFVALSDEGFGVATDPVSGHASDSLLTILLAAGEYTLALSQNDNFPNLPNLADGFSSFFGTGNFTPLLAADGGFTCPATSFCDYEGNARTSDWTLDVVNVDAIPEPASLALVGLGLAGLGAVRRRRAQV